MRATDFGGRRRRFRRINWRWPLRLWFNSGAEFWEWAICLAIVLGLAAWGFHIIAAP